MQSVVHPHIMPVSNCTGLPIVENGFPFHPNGDPPPHPVGTFLLAECRFNHKRVETPLFCRQRSSDGATYWEPERVVCEAGPCPDPPRVEHGEAVLTDGDCGSLRYECDEGYRIEGTENYVCANDGWRPSRNSGGGGGSSSSSSSSGTRCIRIVCEPGPRDWNVDSGKLRFNTMVSNVVGSRLTLICDEGYRIAGTEERTATRTCEIDGHWNQPVPACEKIKEAEEKPPDATVPQLLEAGPAAREKDKNFGYLSWNCATYRSVTLIRIVTFVLVLVQMYFLRILTKCQNCVRKAVRIER